LERVAAQRFGRDVSAVSPLARHMQYSANSFAGGVRGRTRWTALLTLLVAGLAIFVTVAFVLPSFSDLLLTEKAHRLASASMEPTLLAGDFILASRVARPVQRGEIVVYRTSTGIFAKRVIALPGDTIVMRNGVVSIGSIVIPEPYSQRDTADPTDDEFAWQRAHLLASMDSNSYRPSLHNWGPLVIPPDRYFLLGDNRSNSLDSRYTGLVHRDSIIGHPTVVYFSRDRTTGTIRWRRIGRSAQGPRIKS